MAEVRSKETRLSDRLKQNKFKLNSLLDITKAINNNSTVEELKDIYENIIRHELEISKLILFIKNVEWSVLLQYGLEQDYSSIDPEILFSREKDISLIEPDEKESVGGFDVLIPVFHKEHPLAFLMIGDANEDVIAVSPIIKHLNFIQTLTNVLAVAVENKRLAKEAIEQERLRRELELAADLQTMLIPGELPSNERFDMSAIYLPHQEVGGDYYDYIPLGDKGFMVCVGDVSGKGVAAAFLMANFQATLKTLAISNYPLEKLIHLLNASVYSSAHGERFITFFIAKYDFETGEMEYVNAGHNPALLISSSGVKQLKSGSVGLGMLDELPFLNLEKVKISSDDILICYTDGLVEIENDNLEEFGMDRLGNTVIKNNPNSMEKLNEEIINAFNLFRGKNQPFDDTTLLSCRFH